MTESIEIWKDIEEYKGLYQVSSLGRVKSLYYKKTGKEKIMSSKKEKTGYYRIMLYKYGKGKYYLVHRLVALAFVPNPNNLPEVNHKDENKANNFVWVNEDGSIDLEKSNLEWCNRVYNINYGNRTKKTSKPIKQLTLDGTLVAIWPSINEVKRNGFNCGHICSCCQGQRKTHKGYLWAYLVQK